MKRVYVIGDSISIQYGSHLEQCLRGVAAYARKEGANEALLNLDPPQGAHRRRAGGRAGTATGKDG